ncbi:MAG: hypothetical protein ACJAZ1_000862 [Yoonia sp.]|jgi:uncharacterized protein (DUF1330 family)
MPYSLAAKPRTKGHTHMPRGYIIGHITVTNAEAYQDYIVGNTPIIKAHGGKPIVRGGASLEPEGSPYTRHVIFEFPDYASALALYNDPEYQKVARFRRENATSMIVLAEGV